MDLVPDVLRHRVVLSYEALADNMTTDGLIKRLLAAVPTPDKPLVTSAAEAAAAANRA